MQGVETSLIKQLNNNAYSQVVKLDSKIGGKQVNSGRIGTCFFGRCETRIGQSADENDNSSARNDRKPSLDKKQNSQPSNGELNDWFVATPKIKNEPPFW